jgi:hypothetical protein
MLWQLCGEEHLLLRQYFRARLLHRYYHLYLLSSFTRRAIPSRSHTHIYPFVQ